MIHFHSLRVQKLEKETEDCVSLTFEIPEALQEAFRFRQGQTLTLRKNLGGEDLRRNYSICSSPLENKLQIAVKKMEGGVFSTYANEVLKAGDYLDVLPPTGKFYTELDPRQKKNYVAFAAGSGITPILSIIKTTLQTEPQSRFTLVFGNRTKTSIIFKEALEALKDKYLDRFRIYYLLSREKSDTEIFYGRIDTPKLDLFFEKLINLGQTDEFFICGPEEMIFCVRGYLEGKGVPREKVHFELFTVPGQQTAAVIHHEDSKAEKGPISQVGVRLDGILFEFELGQEDESILDAALRQGADLPYACKGGVCTTCKALLTEGEVTMDVNWGLEPDEVEKGFILTCQSHPKTPRVTVDFDKR